MTNWNVLIEPTQDGQITATVLGLPDLRVVADTRQMALNKIQQLLTERLASTEVVPMSIPLATENNPWVKFGGIFNDDPDFKEIVRDMQSE